MTGDLYLQIPPIDRGGATTIDPIFLPIVERAISVRPGEAFDITDVKYTTNFLYYNRTNALGEVLTSLVYVGTFRDPSSANANVLDTTITYNPELMFRHSNTEQYINVQDTDTDFSGYNHIVPKDLQPLYSTPVDYEVFNRAGKLSNTLGPMDIAFDGWYTLMNVSIPDDDLHLIPGALQWGTGNNYTPYQTNDANVRIDINEFTDPSLKMGELPYLNENNYKKQDFFVLYDFKILYKDELARMEELKYKAEYSSILEKGKVLDFLLESKDFLGAQQLLQTVEDSILLNVIQ